MVKRLRGLVSCGTGNRTVCKPAYVRNRLDGLSFSAWRHFLRPGRLLAALPSPNSSSGGTSIAQFFLWQHTLAFFIVFGPAWPLKAPGRLTVTERQPSSTGRGMDPNWDIYLKNFALSLNTAMLP